MSYSARNDFYQLQRNFIVIERNGERSEFRDIVVPQMDYSESQRSLDILRRCKVEFIHVRIQPEIITRQLRLRINAKLLICLNMIENELRHVGLGRVGIPILKYFKDFIGLVQCCQRLMFKYS